MVNMKCFCMESTPLLALIVVGVSCRTLKWLEPLAQFKARLASGEDVFGELIDRMFLNNTHRVTVITLPDSELGKKTEAKEKSRLTEARAGMSTEQVGFHTRPETTVTILNRLLIYRRCLN